MLKVGLNGFERSGAPGLRKIWSGGAIFHEFGQVGEIRRLGGTRFWRVWQLESVRRRRPAAEQREASPPPTHPEVGVSASQAVRGVFGCGWGPTPIGRGW